MDQRLVTALQAVGSMNKQEAAVALVSALVAIGSRRHPVRAARNGFSTIRTKARHGTPQLIGRKHKGMTIVMSLSDLVDMVQVTAKGQSLGEALDAAGFQPVSGKRTVIREGFPPEPLVRWKNKGAGGD